MNSQIRPMILMIEPVAFGFNEQTSVNNHFQHVSHGIVSAQDAALAEFRAFVELLRKNDVEVLVVQDTPDPHTPDSIFPNNWISFHNGTVVLYPMFAPNRRAERRTDILDTLKGRGYGVERIVDYTRWELQGRFLEGTGSMVLDRDRRIAFAALSERTDEQLVSEFCRDLGYEPVCFDAVHRVDGALHPIYHTNVMMSVAREYAVVCLESIPDENQRRQVVEKLAGKTIIPITEEQMKNLAGNVLQIFDRHGEPMLVMSRRACQSLGAEQIACLERCNRIVIPDIPTIEELGGGGVRCMMAEVY